MQAPLLRAGFPWDLRVGRRGAEVARQRAVGLYVLGRWALNPTGAVVCPSKFIKVSFVSEDDLGTLSQKHIPSLCSLRMFSLLPYFCAVVIVLLFLALRV